MTNLSFDHSYRQLPERFFERVMPTQVSTPRLIRLNSPLARDLGLAPEWLASEDGIAFLSGNRMPSAADPIALAYAGHQFGHFVPQLGDGRAILLGELLDRNGRRFDIQLKGSGRTRFSRGGDGRAALGPVLREYIVSEAMASLGVPTTRALAALSTGEFVRREATALPGAILVRVASSHIRIGTFQYFAARGDLEGLRLLADHVIARHYPQIDDGPSPYLALLKAVVEAQARLIAQWMLIGFIHGVMNTDNMTVSGETIDYGPCAFMEAYDPATVFSAIDERGRYAYGNQPAIARWNLARLAETLLPLISDDEHRSVELATEALAAFDPQFNGTYLSGMRAKLGLTTERPEDLDLIKGLLEAMKAGAADFTLTFRTLGNAAGNPSVEPEFRNLFSGSAGIDDWVTQWRQRLSLEPRTGIELSQAMRSVNPRYIPRNHRIEAVIAAAVEQDDFTPFEELLAVLAQPYDDQPAFAHYATPAEPHERVVRTFCGT